MSFDDLFKRAMGINEAPFPFQRRFATSNVPPSLVRAPTGLGKTATVMLGWIWRWFYASPAIGKATPRRLTGLTIDEAGFLGPKISDRKAKLWRLTCKF